MWAWLVSDGLLSAQVGVHQPSLILEMAFLCFRRAFSSRGQSCLEEVVAGAVAG
jgi:hypothetical protein